MRDETRTRQSTISHTALPNTRSFRIVYANARDYTLTKCSERNQRFAWRKRQRRRSRGTRDKKKAENKTGEISESGTGRCASAGEISARTKNAPAPAAATAAWFVSLRSAKSSSQRTRSLRSVGAPLTVGSLVGPSQCRCAPASLSPGPPLVPSLMPWLSPFLLPRCPPSPSSSSLPPRPLPWGPRRRDRAHYGPLRYPPPFGRPRRTRWQGEERRGIGRHLPLFSCLSLFLCFSFSLFLSLFVCVLVLAWISACTYLPVSLSWLLVFLRFLLLVLISRFPLPLFLFFFYYARLSSSPSLILLIASVLPLFPPLSAAAFLLFECAYIFPSRFFANL